MEITHTISAPNRSDLRAWFEQNHERETEIWIIFYKKGSGIPSVSLAEAQEEALCFGWIDGILKSIDEQKYAIRFTPRKNNQNWSETNIRRVRRMDKEGRMTPAGLKLINFSLEGPDEPPDPRAVPEMPEDLLADLQTSPTAWGNWQNLPPSQQKIYLGWILSAKRPETRRKRISLAVELLEYNLRLGMESPETILARAKAASDS